MDSIFTVMLILLCLCLEGLYSGGEIAFVSSNIDRIKHRAKEGSRSALLALKLLESPEWFLATTLTGTNLCIVTSTTLTTALFVTLLGAAQGAMAATLVIVPTLLVMIVSRSLFQQHAETMAIILARFIWYSSFLFYPVVYLIARISRGTVKLSTGETGRTYSYVTKNGLKYILEEQNADTDILSMEKDMVRNVIDFSDVTVGDIMVPVSKMISLPVTATLREATKIAAEKQYLRIPVYRDQVINIIGILHYFDLLQHLHEQTENRSHVYENETVEICLNPVDFYVPETRIAKDLLVDLQVRGERMAVVVDEYGGAVGIVTVEDILEEVVGEIDDEYDSGEKLYKKIGPRKYLFNAQISVDKVRHLISVDIPDGDYETLGGFLLYKIGKIPRRRETLKYGDAIFVVEDADAKSIKEVFVLLPASDGDRDLGN
ncbi:MAG: hemolysin family protein [Deltaproteobacteria bacterium]